MASIKRHLLVDLDALLDTRLALLGTLNPELAEQVLGDNSYHKRVQDAWQGLDYVTFKAHYAKRDTDILTRSVMTGIVKLVKDFVVGSNQETLDEPMRGIPKVTVNTYPYTLDRETELTLIDVLSWRVGDALPAHYEAQSLSPDVLTPAYCAKNFTMMVKYDGLDWMEYHSSAFEETQLPFVQLIVPALFHDVDPESPEIQSAIAEGIHPFKAIKELAQFIIRLELIDAEHFSIVKPEAVI